MKIIAREESLKELQRKNLYLQLNANWTHSLQVHLGEGVKIGHRQREGRKSPGNNITRMSKTKNI